MQQQTETSLAHEFVLDHRLLTRGMADLLKALQAHDDAVAVRLAEYLDRLAGPHIEFEETGLYPVVAREEGGEFAGKLYQEHRTALDAINWLRANSSRIPFSDEDRERLLRQVQTGMDHAVSCGSLLSHLTTLGEDEKHELLDALLACRDRGVRWSDWSRRNAPADLLDDLT